MSIKTTVQNFSELLANNNVMQVSGPITIDKENPPVINELVLLDNGVLYIKKDCHLTLNKITNNKNAVSLNNYEFIIIGENGNNADEGENGGDAKSGGNVEIKLGEIQGNIRIKAHGGNGGAGFNGINGKDGGDGGNGYQGGNGGSGSDAIPGTNGGDGGSAPKITITYEKIANDSKIYVNDLKIKKTDAFECPISGGKGGKGGTAAMGGKGGKGGKGNDGGDGISGKDGKNSIAGDAGKDGDEDLLKLNKISLAEKLENLRGTYVFNLSNNEEYDYVIQNMGGIEKLNKKAPLLLAAMNENRLKNNNEREKPCFSISKNGNTFYSPGQLSKESNTAENSNLLNDTEYKVMGKSYCINLYDNKTSIKDSITAKKWKYLSLNIRTSNVSSGISIPVLSRNYEIYETNGNVVEFLSDPLETRNFNGTLATKIDIYGLDVDGQYFAAHYAEKEKDGNVSAIEFTVHDIKIDNPHWNGKHKNEIVMLYGRTNECPEYANADYVGGEYYSNTIKKDIKEIATLMPVSGTITLHGDYEPVDLTPVDDVLGFTRSTINYDNKSAEDNCPDIVYQNTVINDKELYQLMIYNNCFKKNIRAVNSEIKFDLSLDRKDGTSKLDWHHNIAGENDNKFRTIMLQAAFTYRVHKRNALPKDFTDIVFCITSVTKKNLEAIKREYYTFLRGSHTIYIPPIYIYWGCFGKNTLIKTEDGTCKTAASICIGDRLETEGGKIVTVNEIYTGVDDKIYRLKLQGGYETLLSGSHPVLDENGKGIPVKMLKANKSMVKTEKNTLALVEYVAPEPYNDTVYNFTFVGESESVFIIADGIYAGDLNAQNAKPESPEETEEEKQRTAQLIKEFHRLRM